MKKILLTMVAGALMSSLSAQNWVETTAQKRKVVLEEFTGVRCTFCPDGHKRANELKKANSGNVFLVNVHAGGYATPGAGDIDLRTSEGTALDNAAGTMGYPNGSVNRNKSPWNSSRSAWASEATAILGESSPVNVYVKSSVDYSTRTLTTEVEVYYTSDGSANNRLSIALTQNEILGQQTGATTFYPENFYQGDYIHNHAFRRFITTGGVGGETLDSTTKDAYIYRKFVTVLPAKIGPIDLNINKLEVVAFVTDNVNNKILSGHGADVSTNDPTFSDLAIASTTITPSALCDQVTPKFTVTNKTDANITSFDVKLMNGTTVVETKSFSGTLAKDASTDISFSPTDLDGEYSFSSNIDNINSGTLVDGKFSNNKTAIAGLGFTKKAFSYYKFNFDTPGVMDKNTGRDLSKNSSVVPVTYSTPIGQASPTAIRFDLRSVLGLSGKPGHIILGEADFTSVTDPQVNYWYAYSAGTFGTNVPSIKVSISENCGVSWTNVNTTACISTGVHTSATTYYSPKTGDYQRVTVDLAAYAAKSVLVRVSGVPGSDGNSLYIDQIEIGSTKKITGITKVEELSFNVYPNPASDNVNISTNNTNSGTVSVLNLQGQSVLNATIENGATSISTSTLVKGIYMVEVVIDGAKQVQKITIL